VCSRWRLSGIVGRGLRVHVAHMMFAAGSVLVSSVFVGVLLQVWCEHVLQQYVSGSSVDSGVVDTSTVAPVKAARIRQKLLPRPHPIPQQTRVFGVKRREEVSLLNSPPARSL